MGSATEELPGQEGSGQATPCPSRRAEWAQGDAGWDGSRRGAPGRMCWVSSSGFRDRVESGHQGDGGAGMQAVISAIEPSLGELGWHPSRIPRVQGSGSSSSLRSDLKRVFSSRLRSLNLILEKKP